MNFFPQKELNTILNQFESSSLKRGLFIYYDLNIQVIN